MLVYGNFMCLSSDISILIALLCGACRVSSRTLYYDFFLQGRRAGCPCPDYRWPCSGRGISVARDACLPWSDTVTSMRERVLIIKSLVLSGHRPNLSPVMAHHNATLARAAVMILNCTVWAFLVWYRVQKEKKSETWRVHEGRNQVPITCHE